MTKAQELNILDNTIAALGKDSYCGPWLATIRFEVEQSLRSDIFPEFSLRAAQVECAELKKQTAEQCLEMRGNAGNEIKRLRAEALKYNEQIAEKYAMNVKEQLRQAKWALDKVIADLP